MKILVLGGTLFLGRAVIEAALVAGHDITMFNRGRTNPALFTEVEHLRGDRDVDLSAIAGRSFDAVVDTSAYFPRQVRDVVEVLDSGIGHYVFVSSCSAYADHSIVGQDESAELETVEEPSVEELGEHYGGFKALCERELDELIPGRAHHVRAGLIVGPHDNTGRFSYWVERFVRGGEVLAPEPADQPVQFIDVRDVADWILHASYGRLRGAYNVLCPPGETTMNSLLTTVADCTDSDASIQWVSEEFLLGEDVEPWSDLPLWLPPTGVPTHAGFMSLDTTKAVEAGLRIRPLDDTVRTTHDWLESGEEVPAKDFGTPPQPAGLPAEREAKLLAAWKATQG